jgi:hypothetical protein
MVVAVALPPEKPFLDQSLKDSRDRAQDLLRVFATDDRQNPVALRQALQHELEWMIRMRVDDLECRIFLSCDAVEEISFRFDLASGLLSRAMDATLIAAKVRRVMVLPALTEAKDGSSSARRGGGFGCTLPHFGFNPEN